MSLLLLWNLSDELVSKDHLKQLFFPVSWSRRSVRRAYSGEARINPRAGLLHCLSAFQENAVMNLSPRNLLIFHTYAHLALVFFFEQLS